MAWRTFTDPITYGHAVGRIRVLETRLISRERIDRLIEAPDLTEQYRVLADTDYSPFLEGMESYEDIEKGLEDYLGGVYGFLEEVCPKSKLVDFFRLRYDFHNLRVILKAKHLGEEIDYLWIKLGLFDVKDIQSAVKEDRLPDLPLALREGTSEAEVRFKETNDPQVIDVSLDRELYGQLGKIAKDIGDKFLLELTKIFIDLANLKAVSRAKHLGKDSDFVEQVLIEGGGIARESFLALYLQNWEALVEWLDDTPYGVFLKRLVSEEGLEGTLFDKYVDNFVADLVAKKRYVTVGLEPIVWYLLAKENEVKTLRMILVGKLAGLSSSQLEARVREVLS